jgi:hypothetical protein
MKNLFIILLFILAACTNPANPTDPAVNPYIRGHIAGTWSISTQWWISCIDDTLTHVYFPYNTDTLFTTTITYGDTIGNTFCNFLNFKFRGEWYSFNSFTGQTTILRPGYDSVRIVLTIYWTYPDASGEEYLKSSYPKGWIKGSVGVYTYTKRSYNDRTYFLFTSGPWIY